MKSPTGSPCQECPFRKKSLQGYVGAATPAEFVLSAEGGQQPMPCHMDIDYEKKDWKDKQLPNAHQCSGHAIFLSNMCKGLLGPGVHRLPADTENVFQFPSQMLQYHTHGKMQTIADAWQEVMQKDEAPVVEKKVARTKFGQAVDAWYDKLIDRVSPDTVENGWVRASLLRAASRKPTPGNLRLLRETLNQVGLPVKLATAMDVSVVAVTRKAFRKEFRYTYSRRANEVSACSELFSMVRQAVTYADVPSPVTSHFKRAIAAIRQEMGRARDRAIGVYGEDSERLPQDEIDGLEDYANGLEKALKLLGADTPPQEDEQAENYNPDEDPLADEDADE